MPSDSRMWAQFPHLPLNEPSLKLGRLPLQEQRSENCIRLFSKLWDRVGDAY